MNLTFLSQINYFAVAVSSIVFFMLGSLWFSVLFGITWVRELKKHNVIIKEPKSSILLFNMLVTFAANVLASLAMAILVSLTHSNTLLSGLSLGLIASFGFAVTTLASVFIWENRSLKLFLIDIGYPTFGIIATAIILSLWR